MSGFWICMAVPVGLILLLVLSAVFAYARLSFRFLTNDRPGEWLRVCLGRGLPPGDIARRIGVELHELIEVTPGYAEAYVPKRSGGTRRLLIPDDETKAIQRKLLRRMFKALRAHPAACGFERGKSIVDNALPHVGQAVVVNLDVEDFFPSTTVERVDLYFRRIGWNADAAALLVKLTTHEGGLPQGAPTSPRLSNLVNYYLDVQLQSLATRRKGNYTRYADDVTFSFPKDYPKRVRGVVQKARHILKVHGYRMHRRKKLHIRRRHQRQMVTGLVVNEVVQLPRKLRRKLRAMEHRVLTDQPITCTPQQFEGWMSLLTMIDEQSFRAFN